MLSFREAQDRLLAAASFVGAERVNLEEACGRVLAEDVVAPAPMPAFDHSSMDGYAFASAALVGMGPWELSVVGESAAGGPLPRYAEGTACRIFTGARLPDGADSVVPQEDAPRTGERIALRARPKPGQWIRRCGEDLALGAVALRRGARLTPGRVALAAALDRPFVTTARRPVVTILCTGDELRSPGEAGPPGSIAESNGFFVALAARAAGATARIAPFVRDEADVAVAACAEALRGTDLLVTIGGVSVGDRDVMRPALEAAGVTLDFWRVAIKPGKPLAVGHASGVHVLGLPGNPASASLTFLLFGIPLLRALQGDAAPLPVRFPVRIVGELRRRPGREEFLRVKLELRGGAAAAVLLPNQSSGAVTSFAEADGLAVVPAERDRVDDGDMLDAIRIADI